MTFLGASESDFQAGTSQLLVADMTKMKTLQIGFLSTLQDCWGIMYNGLTLLVASCYRNWSHI